MFARIFDRLERRVDVFAPFDVNETPPANVWGFLWFYVKPFRGLLLVTFSLTALIGVIEASMVLVIGRFIDLLATSTPERFLTDHGAALLGILVLVAFVRPVLAFVGELVVNQMLSQQMMQRVRWRTHNYTLGHALSYFQNDFAGRLGNRIIQAGGSIRDLVVETVDILVYVAVYAIVALVAFSAISLWLGLPVLLWIGAYVLLLRYFVPRAITVSERQSDARSVVVGRVVDAYTNILTVKLFSRLDTERSSVREAQEKHMAIGFEQLRLLTGTLGVLFVLNAALIVATGVIAVVLWSNGSASVGEIAAALALVMRMNDMSRWVMQVARALFENLGTVQESMETIAKPHALVDRPGAAALAVKNGAIRFEDVTFHYGKGAGVLEKLSLSIAPGERVGIVGPSGAGKSTLVALLLRLHDVEAGRVTIDGHDISRVTQDSLREAIGVVTQDNALLHRSIAENIAYGKPEATRGEVEAAALNAQAHAFIMGLKDRDERADYDSRVGERGVKLSGGQRQRIAIARVLLKDAPILVLDEATSALDSEVEAAIQESLERLMAGKTVIAIAHRLSTIAALDRLIVMDGGRIVEEGAHAELVAAGGLYARLWARQSGGFLGHAEDEAAR
jgi:ATP-binding cassette subfamily B multidrug efflux pump